MCVRKLALDLMSTLGRYGGVYRSLRAVLTVFTCILIAELWVCNINTSAKYFCEAELV